MQQCQQQQQENKLMLEESNQPKQNDAENKLGTASFSLDENMDLILNELILPDTRIFASLLKDFNNNKDLLPNLTLPDSSHPSTSNPLSELAYKTLIIGNSEHIILDNPNNLSDFRGSYEKLKNVALALANKLNKPVSVPAFLLIDDECALESVKDLLAQKQIHPIIIESENSSAKVTPPVQAPTKPAIVASKKRASKPKANTEEQPSKRRATDHKSNKKSQPNAPSECVQTSHADNTSFDVNQKLEQIKRENKLAHAAVNSETNAQVESIINNIKSSLIAAQNQGNLNLSNQQNQVNVINNNNNTFNNNNNNTNNNVINSNDVNKNNVSGINHSLSVSNDVDLNCYSLDSNSLFNLNFNNMEWIA